MPCNVKRQKWLLCRGGFLRTWLIVRDNLLSSLFALVTYVYVKNWFTHLKDRGQTTSCLDCNFFLTQMDQKFQIMIFTLADDHFTVWPSSVTLTFDLAEQTFQMNNSYCAILFRNPYINVQVMARTSSVYEHFISWPSSVTLTFNLPEQVFQMTLLFLKENNCAELFWNLYIKAEVIAQTRSIYDHFLIWPSSVTLTLNQPEQMFQMPLLLLEDNKCVKLFWNPCINIENMTCTSSIYDHFI